MSLDKVIYKDGVTVIHAQNLNEIQDEVIRQDGVMSNDVVRVSPQTLTPEQQSQIRVNIGIDFGLQGTPIAERGDVENNQVSVTPKCTDTTGYI